jgi:hypothetical protein
VVVVQRHLGHQTERICLHIVEARENAKEKAKSISLIFRGKPLLNITTRLSCAPGDVRPTSWGSLS